MKRSLKKLKKYQNAGSIDSGLEDPAIQEARDKKLAGYGTLAGAAAPMIGALIPDKKYTDSKGNSLGSRKSIGESTLEAAGTGASMGAAFGPLGMAIGGGLGAGYGAITGWMEKDKMDEAQQERNKEIQRQDTYDKMNTTVNWGKPNVNTSNNMMFARGGILTEDDPNANAELELQETFQLPDGQVGNVDGPSHDAGGIEVDLPEGTRVFSDRLKHNGKTFAKHTKPITNRINKLEKSLEETPYNSEAKKNSILLLNKQLDNYFEIQESNKETNEMKRTFKKGGILSKHTNGGEINGKPRLKIPVKPTDEIDPNTGRPTGAGGLEDASLDLLQAITVPLALTKAARIAHAAYNINKSNVINLSKLPKPTYKKAARAVIGGFFEKGGLVKFAKGGLVKYRYAGVTNPAQNNTPNKTYDPKNTLASKNTFSESWNPSFNQMDVNQQDFSIPSELTTPQTPFKMNNMPLGSNGNYNPNSPQDINMNRSLQVNPKPFSLETSGLPNPTSIQPVAKTGQPDSFGKKLGDFAQKNIGTIGQVGSALGSAITQNSRLNRLARPKTLAKLKLTDKMANPEYVDYSADRNSISRASLNARDEAQRGFGSSATAQAFKNKARLNEMEATGKSYQNQENVNTQIGNEFAGRRQEAGMREAMMNNEIDKYNLENTYGYDSNMASQKNAITAMLGNTAGQVFGNKTKYDNQIEQAKIMSNSKDGEVWNSTIMNTAQEPKWFAGLSPENKAKHNAQRARAGHPPLKYGGTIRSLKRK